MNKYCLASIVYILMLSIGFHLASEAPVEAQASGSCLTLSPWTKVAQAPANHLEGATAVVNNRLFIIGGFKDSDLNAFGRVDVYNPQTNVWETVTTPRKALPINLTHAQTVVDGNDIWIVGGFVGKNPGPPTNQVWRYNVANDQWYSGPALPAKRAGGGIALVNRKIHYIGGTANDRDTTFDNHWILDLNNTGAGWKNASTAFPDARIQFGMANISGKLYVIGGQYRHDHDPVDLPLVHRYDTATGQWKKLASLPFGRSHFEPGTVVYDGNIIIVGGRANQNGYGFGQIKNVTAYNPSTNTWYDLPELPVKLIAPNAAVINNRLIVTTGGTNWNTGQKNTYISTISYTPC